MADKECSLLHFHLFGSYDDRGPGVVKNLEGRAHSVKSESCFISPDYEKIGPLPLRRQGSFSIK